MEIVKNQWVPRVEMVGRVRSDQMKDRDFQDNETTVCNTVVMNT